MTLAGEEETTPSPEGCPVPTGTTPPIARGRATRLRSSRPAHVTLSDVARASGTSASTASRALSGRGYVAEAVRTRLLATAEQLGYVPNASARTLKQQRSRVIGVVVSDVSNPFYARVAAGTEQTLRELDYQMVLVTDNNEASEELLAARTFLALRAPGVVITPLGGDASLLLRSHGVAVVEVDRQLAPGQCDGVVLDNVRGAREATEHLLELGHRRIGLLVVDTDWTSDAGRLDGYREAMEAAGLGIDERLVVKVGPRETATIGRQIGALVDARQPTALFAANNVLAVEAWHVMRSRGIRLPSDMSLIGFDDVPWMEMVSPGLTVVSQPALEFGRRAARLLLERLEQPGRPARTERLAPELVVRASTAPPRGELRPHRRPS